MPHRLTLVYPEDSVLNPHVFKDGRRILTCHELYSLDLRDLCISSVGDGHEAYLACTQCRRAVWIPISENDYNVLKPRLDQQREIDANGKPRKEGS